MENVVLEQQKSRYDLERTIHTLEVREKELEQEVDSAGAIFMTLYEAMAAHEKSLTGRLKKLLKKPDSELEKRYNDAVLAERQLKQAEDALEDCRKARTQAVAKLAQLPTIDLLRIRAKKDPETIKAFAKAEAHYCVEQLTPLMDANWQALQELADFLRENEHAEKFPQSEFNRLFNGALDAAKACQPYLNRLQDALEYLPNLFFTLREYYVDPKEFIWNARNGRNYSDRVTAAMKQVREQKDRAITSLTWIG